MNDPTVPNQTANTGLSTAIVDVQTADGEPIRWTFPVINNYPTQMVTQEIRERLRTNEGLDINTLRVAYPAGPWNQPLDRDIPVIGAGSDPAPKPPQAARTAQNFRSQPETNERRLAPPSAQPDYMGPLPDANQQVPTADVAFAELDDLLNRWSRRHRLSSAEYYLFLSRALATHAMRLVSMDRRTPQRPQG